MKGIRHLSFLSIKGLEMRFMAVKKLRNCSGFVIYSYFQDSAVTAVKRDQLLLTRFVKGEPVPAVQIVECSVLEQPSEMAFPATYLPAFPDPARPVSNDLVFTTSLVSESLAQAIANLNFKRFVIWEMMWSRARCHEHRTKKNLSTRQELNLQPSVHRRTHGEVGHTLFFLIRMLFFRPRLNILIFLPILGWKYSCIILKL